MQLDPVAEREMLTATRRGPSSRASRPWLQLLSAVMELAGRQVELVRHAERPWASATFTGSRHTIALAFAGSEGVAAGEAFVTALPDHEFTLARQIVADAAIVEVDQQLLPEQRMTVEIELLLLDDS